MLVLPALGFPSVFSLADDEGSSHVIFHHHESGLRCCLKSESSAPLVQAATCDLPGLSLSSWKVCYPVRVTQVVHSQLS